MSFALIFLLVLSAAPLGPADSSNNGAEPQATRKIPPDKAVIQFKTPAGAVSFKHEQHATKYGVACEKCHHTLQGKPQETPQACSTCHLKAGTPKVPSLRDAVHKTCGECHKEQQTKGKKAPLASQCNGCHVRGS